MRGRNVYPAPQAHTDKYSIEAVLPVLIARELNAFLDVLAKESQESRP
ncbi:MAG: hypothetical protein ACRD0U_12635 [Acidimicrobiales bacterium]